MPPANGQPHSYESVIGEIARRLGYPPSKAAKLFRLDPFDYVINFIPATLSVTTTGTFTVEADSAFALCQGSFTVADTNNLFSTNISDIPRYAPFLVNLVDSGSGRELSNTAAPINAFYGTGEWPCYWPVPKILKPNSVFTVRVQNLLTVNMNVRLVHRGYKIFGRVDLFLKEAGIE